MVCTDNGRIGASFRAIHGWRTCGGKRGRKQWISIYTGGVDVHLFPCHYVYRLVHGVPMGRVRRIDCHVISYRIGNSRFGRLLRKLPVLHDFQHSRTALHHVLDSRAILSFSGLN